VRAASRLARSGGFGLIVVDLAGASLAAASGRSSGRRGRDLLDAARMTEVPLPLQSRLTGLAQTHDVAVVFLTEKTRDLPSLGTLVSFRGASRRERDERGRYLCRVEAIKDKRRGPGWSHTEVRRGPAGLC